MKILHVSGPSRGGIARHIEQLRQGLAAWGVNSQLSQPVRAHPGSVLRIYREIRQGKCNLVHCHGYQGGAVGRAAAALAGIPAIVTIHNTLQIKGLARLGARLAEDWMGQKTAWWVAVSAFLRNYAWRELGVPDERTEIIANGVELPAVLPPRQLQPVIGTVARLIPTKGIDVFIRAVQLLRPEIPGLQAVIIGEGPAAKELKDLCRNLGLNGTVQFLGHREDVPDQLMKMAVFILPTRSEGLGISVLEAMAMGVPVVATAVGGVPELVKHNDTGILVRQDEYGAIARSVRLLLRDREKAESLRIAAYEHVAKNYRAETMLRRTYELYERVINV